MKEAIEFTGEAQQAIELVQNSNKSLFITGKAGTGKSTLLSHICGLPDANMIVLAPTGIAAINVGGETIHSFFKLKPGYELDEAANIKVDKERARKYQAIKTIIIDEISMVRADILDAIDIFLRKARRNGEHFGGVRMIFFGDLYQLPPVVSNHQKEQFFQNYKYPYFFDADVFKKMDLFTPAFSLTTIELNEVYRQKDADFVRVLNAIREKAADRKDLAFLNQNVNPSFKADKDTPFVHLMATNAKAAEMNMQRLEEINADPIEFTAVEHGQVGSLQPNDPKVTVKIGAQVMFINNDFERKWVNGTIGKVIDFVQEPDEDIHEIVDKLVVQLENGKRVKVQPHTWEISKYTFAGGTFTREEIGHFTQIPLKLAWAMTIHKSQGKTFDKVVIDLGRGSFAHGQTYVALSRCTSMQGLVLKQAIRPSDIIVDPAILSFHAG